MKLTRPRSRVAGTIAVLLTLVTATACSGTAGSATSGSKNITIATVPWEEGIAASHLWEQILEDKGYTVTVKQLDAGPIFDGLASGQIDIFLDMWPSYHKPFLQRYKSDIKRIGPWYGPTELNLAVPKYVSGVKTIEDLKGKAGEFDNRIVGIEAGSELMGTLKKKVVPEYGLNDYKAVSGSTTAMIGALEKATRAKKPILVTLWQPHWAFGKYPIKDLKDTKGAFGAKGEIEAVSSTDFAKEHSDVVKWLKKFDLDSRQLAELQTKMHDGGEGNESETVGKWIRNNKSLTGRWTDS